MGINARANLNIVTSGSTSGHHISERFTKGFMKKPANPYIILYVNIKKFIRNQL